MAKASLHIPHFGMAEFFRQMQPQIVKYFSPTLVWLNFSAFDTHDFPSHFYIGEFFRGLQHQIAKFFSLACQMCKTLPI